MSRFLTTSHTPDDLSLDVSDDMLRGVPNKDSPDGGSSNSSYSPYAFPSDLKPDLSHHSTDDKDGSAFANSLIAQSLNADGTPKRPMNAFMIFARKRRPEVSAANQMMRTGEISKILSKEWNAMDITQKQFYLDQAKRLKDTFNSKYPDYVYRRRPNNSRKKRRTDPGSLSLPSEPDDLSPGDPSPVDGDDLDDHPHSQYSFDHQGMSSAGLDDLFNHTQNSSTLPSHGSYSPYSSYPQSNTHRNHHLPHHQSHQHDYPHSTPRSAHSGSLSFSSSQASVHSQSSLRSAPPIYSSHDSGNSPVFPHQPSLPSLSSSTSGGNGNGYLPSSSQHNGYWNSYHDRNSGHSPHHTTSGGSSNASGNQGSSSMNAPWSHSLPPPVPNHHHHQFPSQTSGRERSYTTTVLPTMKSSFPSSGIIHQTQLPLPPMMTSNGSSLPSPSNGTVRRPLSGGHGSSHHGAGHLLPPTLTTPFYPSSSSNAGLASPSGSSGGGGGSAGTGYFSSPPSTTSSASTGTAGGGDRLLTPPELSPFDIGRHGHNTDISIGVGGGTYGGWDRK